MRILEPAEIAEILRKALAAGDPVEIPGLGVFEAGPEATCRFTPRRRLQAFVAYAVEDQASVRRLCADLEHAGLSPWLDKERLLPGQNWPRAIERAIEISDIFIGCFSRRSVAKRGQFQSELRYALECARRRPLDEVFVIPVRLEECEVPRRITNQVQYVDLFPDWERGVRRIVRAAKRGARRRVEPVLES